jgi:outer membrane receptor protein involved in Fe transport
MARNRSQLRPIGILLHLCICLSLTIAIATGAQGQGSKDESEEEEDIWAGAEEMVVSGSAEGSILDDIARSNSVTAFDASELEAIGAADISDIASFTPNLEIVVAGSTSPTFFIRGIGLNDFNANAAGAVAIYTDDVPLNSPALQLGSIFDIESAAVLRGPQGTGPFRNASAGAIKLYSRKPTGSYGVTFSAELGNYNAQVYQGSIEFPVTPETLWARLSFTSTHREGTFSNRCDGAPAIADREQQPGGVGAVSVGWCDETVANEKFSLVDPNMPSWLNSRDNWAARGVFLVHPEIDGDIDSEWLITVRGSRRDEPSFVGQSIGTTGKQRFIDETLNDFSDLINEDNDLRPAIQGTLGGQDLGGYVDRDVERAIDDKFETLISQCSPCTNGEIFARQFESKRGVASDLARDLDRNPHEGNISHAGGTTNDTYGGSLKGSIEIGDVMELTSITAYDGWQRRVDTDLDFSPNTLFQIDTKDDGWQVFQELRLNGQAFDGLDEVFGGPLDWEVGAFVLAEELNVEVDVDNGDAPQLGGAASGREYTQNLLSLAAYATFAWDFWDAFTLDGGARFNYEKRQLDYKLFVIGPVFKTNSKLIGEEPTGTIRMTYRPNESSSIYVKYTHGWKSGTFNATGSAFLGVTNAQPEKIDSFEVGLRGSYFDNRLNLSTAVFHYTYEQYQLFTSLTAFQTPPQFIILNASDVELYGAEIEATILPWDGGLIDIRFAWLEGTFINFVQTELRTRTIQEPFFAIIPIETDHSGNKLLNAPEYSITLSAQQAIPLGRYGSLIARWDGTWKDVTYFDATEGRGLPNQDLDLILPENTIGQQGYWLHNLRLSYIVPDESIVVAAWVRNLADQTYKAFSADLSGFAKTTLHFVGDPRTFGVTTSIKF